MTKLRHRLKNRRHGPDTGAARRLRTATPLVALPAEDLQTNHLHHTSISHNKSSVIPGRRKNFLNFDGGGASNGQAAARTTTSNDRILAGLCRSEEGRVKIIWKVATQGETSLEL